MSKMKKILALALAGMMTFSLVACGSEKTGDPVESKKESEKTTSGSEKTENESIYTPNGTYPIVKEPIELSMFTFSMPNLENYETNDFTKYMEEKTGIKLKFEAPNRDDAETKLNLALSTNDYPDIIMNMGADMTKYGVKEGIFIKLDDYINEDLMPNYVKAMGSRLDTTRETDGHIYGIASLNECYHCQYAKKMWVNTYWLDKLGVGVPTTTEEFYDVCKKFLEVNPKGIAIGGANVGWHLRFEEFFINAFTFEPGRVQSFRDKTVINKKTGEVMTIANTDEYKDALAYMNSLYKLGAIYDGNFTQNEENLRTLANQEGEPVLFIPAGTISMMFDAEQNNEAYRHYQVISPIKGPKGVQNATYMKYSGIGQGAFVITDKCKYPEAALRWIDHFFTYEGSLAAQFGADEGKDWVMNPEGKVGLDGKPALYEILNDYSPEIQNHDWQDLNVAFRPTEFRMGQATDANVDVGSAAGLEKLLFDATKNKMEPFAQSGDLDIMPRLKLTEEETTEIQTIGVEIENYIEENMVAFITGTKSLEKDWDSYVAGFDNLGLPTLLKVYQTAYDRQMKK